MNRSEAGAFARVDAATDAREALRIARARNGVHCGSADEEISNLIGVTGELAFARRYGLLIDDSIMHEGDRGVDFIVHLLWRTITIDVKTAQANSVPFLIVGADHVRKFETTLYVLARLWEGRVQFLGWEFRSFMAHEPTRDFGAGFQSHYKAVARLQPMKDLDALMSARKTS